jgi:hypothetical protein
MKGFRRPPIKELPADALVPEAYRQEPPERFTHEVASRQPFFFTDTSGAPSGELSPGTPVSTIENRGAFSLVLDRHGVRMWTATAGLRLL